MSAHFIGRGNGVVITCNHTTAPHKDADGATAFHEGGACQARQSTGDILRSVNRKYAVSVGWHTAVIADRVRDFCPAHAAWWRAYLAGVKRAAAALKELKADEKTAKAQAKRDAKIAREAESKRKRDEKAARSAAYQARRKKAD